MSVIEFKNARGQVRYQPALPDGRRLYNCGWFTEKALAEIISESWFDHHPRLYRSKRRASRKASLRITEEYIRERNSFKEVAK
ncbi:hypothetical protein SEA_HUBBS_21 [Microbacterium phage Hubbs]|nr:hypothetical protein SEA_HUBBS_21 [Microbacterium phage Hubbs]